MLRPFSGELGGLAGINHLAQRRTLRLQKRSFRSHFHGLGRLTDWERQIDSGVLLHLHYDRFLGDAFEARLLGFNPIGSRNQVYKPV